MIAKAIVYFDSPCIVACDAKCHKAWGKTNRPCTVPDPEEPDHFIWLADDELGEAPADPGTYEGRDAKPRTPDELLNKWCTRECERSTVTRQGELAQVPDFSKRVYNMPERHR